MFRFGTATAIVAITISSVSLSAQTQSPTIFFSDLESGPKTGGENNNGVYVTIYGANFGASQGSSYVTVGGERVAGYKVWGASHLWYQKITFQLGAGVSTGNIVVTTSAGSSNGVPFAVRSGNIYCVSVTGSDSNAGTFPSSCWRTLLKARDTVRAGDTVYVRSGVAQSTDDGQGWRAAMLMRGGGSAGNPMAFVAYPGESATIGNTSSPNYGLRFTGAGGYFVFAGLNLRGVEAVDGTFDNSRFVGNDVQCPNGDGYACFGGNTSWVRFYGNHVYNVGKDTASKLYHAVYWGTNSNHHWDAWNSIHDVKGCRALQYHSTNGAPQYDLHAHDNVIYNVRCDGINFASANPSAGVVEAYNNVIYNAGAGPDVGAVYYCLYVTLSGDVNGSGSGAIDIYNNTMYGCGSNYTYGGLLSIDTSSVSLRLRNNIFQQKAGGKYLGPGTTLSQITGSNNLWYGAGSAPTQTSGSIVADAKFANIAAGDFQLNTGSPAIDGGLAIAGLTDAITGIRRPQGAKTDIGAHEFFQGTVTAPSCDFNGDGSVTSADVDMSKDQALGVAACDSADLNGDGTCDVVDVQRAINAALGGACRVGQ